MVTTVDSPLQWGETVATLKLPDQADRHLQYLMDPNNEGKLTVQEREDFAALAELSERFSLVRAEALYLLGRNSSVYSRQIVPANKALLSYETTPSAFISFYQRSSVV